MQNNSKILLVGRASKNIGGNATGGISKHIEDLSKALIQNSIEPYIWDFKINKSYDVDGIHVLGLNNINMIKGILYSLIKLNILFSSHFSHLTLKNKFIVAIQTYHLKQIVEKYQFKTIHVHSLNRPITSFLRDRFPNQRIVITDHGFWQKKGISQNPKNKVYQNIVKNIDVSDKIITISKFSIEQFHAFNLPTEKTASIPNPIDILEIPFNKSIKKENIIFFNGYNESVSRKNIVKLVDALKTNSFFNNYKLVAIVNEEG